MHYRNTIAITSLEGTEVEPHSLWQLKDNVLTLVDDDQYVTSPLTESFYKD